MKTPILAGHPDDLPLGRGLEGLRLLWALDHALQRASHAMQSDHGVTGPQRLAIRIVGRFPRISAGRLAKVLHIHPSTLTGILERLRSSGYVRASPDPRDGRSTLLALTAAGRAIDAKRSGTIESTVARALDGMSAKDVAASRRVLMALTTALTERADARRRAWGTTKGVHRRPRDAASDGA